MVAESWGVARERETGVRQLVMTLSTWNVECWFLFKLASRVRAAIRVRRVRLGE
jgi:hypothetical protein